MNIVGPLVVATGLNFALTTGALLRAVPPDKGIDGDVLRGRALELVEPRGRVRARIDVEETGEVVLRLLDQDGTIRVKLGASRDGSGLLLANDATEPGVHIVAGRAGSSVRVVGKDGRQRLITP
jgi:hypothetical protein